MSRLIDVFVKLTLILFLNSYSSYSLAVLPNLEFSLHKNGPELSAEANKFDPLQSDSLSSPTLLVIGGIQGDEPGGFTAASLLVTHYKITSGQVWVVPNLNFASIIKRSRGIHGDMNRKFSKLKRNDPEFETVQKIKQIITSPDVDVILNLHDGSGFYHERYIDAQHNPNRWGQSLIIDQAEIGVGQYSQLKKIGVDVVESVNKRIKNNSHYYRIKNTHTAKGDKEMEKTLTYFAINHSKPAFGVEASKNFLTSRRAYYHLLVIESFMKKIGISFERKFDLTEKDIKAAMYDKLQLAFYNNKILLDVANARKRLNYVPLKKNSDINYMSGNPLVAVVSKNNRFNVRYGNRNLTYLKPSYFEYDDSINEITISVDGKARKVNLGSIINVNRHFNVRSIKGYRVNVIGFTKKGVRDESNQTIRQENIRRRYSVDKKSRIYRVEVYQGKKYCGMVLIRFNDSRRTT